MNFIFSSMAGVAMGVSPHLQRALDDLHTSFLAIVLLGQQYGDDGLSFRMATCVDELSRVFANTALRAEWYEVYKRRASKNDPEDYLDLDVLLAITLHRGHDSLPKEMISVKTSLFREVFELAKTQSLLWRDDWNSIPTKWNPDDPLQARSRYYEKFEQLSPARREEYLEESRAPSFWQFGGIMGDLRSLKRVEHPDIRCITKVRDLLGLSGIQESDKERIKDLYKKLAELIGSRFFAEAPYEYKTRITFAYNGTIHAFFMLPEGEVAWEQCFGEKKMVHLKIDFSAIRSRAVELIRNQRKTSQKNKRTQRRRQRHKKIKELLRKRAEEGEQDTADCSTSQHETIASPDDGVHVGHDGCDDDVDPCSICLIEMLATDDVEVKENCKHVYHTVCMNLWRESCIQRRMKALVCPNCGI